MGFADPKCSQLPRFFRLDLCSHGVGCVTLGRPPGTGKTTSVLCLARDLLGEQYKEAVLELNASDDRGIDVVRNTQNIDLH